MKKLFTLVAMATMALAANAQQESAFMDVTALGLSDTKTAVAAGTELCKSTSVTMKAAYACEYKAVAMNGEDDTFKAISIDGTSYANLATGAQGQSNPTNTKKASTQQPTDNAVFQFDVTSDGMLYVFSKLSANKQYYAYEGAYSASTPSSALGYTIVAGSQADKNVYSAAHPADAEGYADFTGYATAETIGTYFLCDLLGIRPNSDANYGTNTFVAAAEKATLLGVAAFPVYAEVGTYYFMAVGSKVTCDGFVFVPGATTVATVNVTEGESTGINNVAAAQATSNVSYNAVGQRVNANSKGMVIRNGKKFMNK